MEKRTDEGNGGVRGGDVGAVTRSRLFEQQSLSLDLVGFWFDGGEGGVDAPTVVVDAVATATAATATAAATTALVPAPQRVNDVTL
jgi:hypothetical protein